LNRRFRNASALHITTLKGIGPSIQNFLKEAGIKSIKDLVVRGAPSISETTGLDIKTSTIICNKARVRLGELGIIDRYFTTSIKRKDYRISLGSRNLDSLFTGGIETDAITEFFGASSTGKTQICHTLAVMVQGQRQQEQSNENLHQLSKAKAIYIDTEGTFREKRIASIAQSRGIDSESVLSNILHARAQNISHQDLILEGMPSLMDKPENENVRLLIIDSIIAHFRSEYVGRGMLPERQQKLYGCLQMLKRISEIYNIAVVITNHVNSSPSHTFGRFTSESKPLGGHVLSHSSTYRVRLNCNRYGNRTAKIVSSPYHPEIETVFTISEEGVSDSLSSTNVERRITRV
jgi:DNA repair protein RadA